MKKVLPLFFYADNGNITSIDWVGVPSTAGSSGHLGGDAYSASKVRIKSGVGGWAVTFGNYIMGAEGIHADPANTLFQHEYGHYIQSQVVGPAYYSRYGIPSLFSKYPYTDHPVEQDANLRAFNYFSEYEEGFSYFDPVSGEYIGKWDTMRNPINSIDWKHFYFNPKNNIARSDYLRPSALDYLAFPFVVQGLLVGVIHSAIDKSTY